MLEKKGVAYWWDGPVEDFLTPDQQAGGRKWRKGTDTIDVWFDSGSSWTMLREIENPSGEAVSTVRPADVCLEGSDQHRGWFQSLLLTAMGSTPLGNIPKAPYRNLITHGFVLDEEGKKMSKSIGNTLSPAIVISGGKVVHSSKYFLIFSMAKVPFVKGLEERAGLWCRCSSTVGSKCRIRNRCSCGTENPCASRRILAQAKKFGSVHLGQFGRCQTHRSNRGNSQRSNESRKLPSQFLVGLQFLQ